MAASQLYDRDFYAWANEQAALLRAGKLGEADIKHIAEEVESLGKAEKQILERAFNGTVLEVIAETGFSDKTFPQQCPWMFDELMIEDSGRRGSGRHAPQTPASLNS
ncbi:MAG: DUF29 domain-containing protein [Alphaproteobacteria bacterium]|nr:DUF29 domain-containing protein [Alphaproteobacteria bacterium]